MRIIVTGASGSMGAAAVRSLAAEGHQVVMACRNLKKGGAIRDAILSDIPGASLELVQVDLSSLKSVREFAANVGKVDAIFNNAGTLNRDYKLTEDGFEQCVQVNYLAPWILCNTLLPQKIVNMVSLTCRYEKIDKDFFHKGPKEFSQLGTYAMSKRALMEFSVDLAARHPEIQVNVADPGVVNSNMISMGRWFDPLADALFRPFCKKPENGVQPALNALHSDLTGELFKGKKHQAFPSIYRGNAWLWDETEKLLH